MEIMKICEEGAHRTFGSSVKDDNKCFKMLLRVQADQQWWRIQR